ncbi:histidine--tRNA ligase [Patescibacteria group bacterium]|nr:histidine--tRNA ligase [Patescibacteria group bacterium]
MEKNPKKPRKPKFKAPTGMHDILLTEQRYFRKIYSVVENIANFYRFEKIDTPILEERELFSKGVGISTDIVQKQMYTLRTRGGDYLALRPEGTAPVVRAYIEQGMQNLPQPVKLWYFGPFFRYEKPQAGRLRQFHSFGFEVLGEENPVIDAQIIQIFYNILKNLKFKNLIVEVNSIGDSQCRPYYKKLLVSYLRSREVSLCSNCRRRLRESPLRILDCKEEKCQPIKSQAPQIIDHLCNECHSHFREVLEFLDELGLPYQLNPYLVRGLDYYTKTVFEISENSEEGRIQGALIGGGRYDALVKILGGKEAPACGGAAGVERIINLMKIKKTKLPLSSKPKIFLAQLGLLAKRKSLKIFEDFRKAKVEVTESFGRDSLKAQLSRADKMGVKYTLILGQKEALEGTIIIRTMETGRQELVKLEKVVEKMKKKLKK